MLYGRKVMFRIPLDPKYKGGYIWNLAFKKNNRGCGMYCGYGCHR